MTRRFERWTAAERGWLTVEYVIVYDPNVGTPLSEFGNVRSFVFHGARSIDMPDIHVIYEMSLELIIVHDAKFEDAKASSHGTG